MGTLTVVGLVIAGIIFLWEAIPTYLNRTEPALEQQAAPAPGVLPAVVMPPDRGQQASALFPEKAPTSLPTPSDIAGQIIANLEEDAQRQAARIDGENQARLKGVESMLRSREQMLDLESQSRLSVLNQRLEETSRANGPNVMRAWLFEFGCVIETTYCPAADASTEEIVDFFDRHIMNNPKYHMIFDDRALESVAGYDPVTGTWDNGAKTYLAD